MSPRLEFGNLPPVDVHIGDCREVMRTLPERSVHTVVTSPPYWALRDYGTALWVGGDEECDHMRPYQPRSERPNLTGSGIGQGGAYFDAQSAAGAMYRDRCDKCGAVRIEPTIWGGDPAHAHVWGPMERGRRKDLLPADETTSTGRIGTTDRQGAAPLSGGNFCECSAWRGAFGLEPTPQLYVEHTVAIFREVRRVLRDDGTVWLNLGDSYASSSTYNTSRTMSTENGWKQDGDHRPNANAIAAGLKAKDLVGIPWRVAFALQADGWYLRSDIIWSKPNPMPESVTDRPAKSHEYLFLLAKSERYFYDGFAIREAAESGPSDLRKMAEGRDRLGGKTLDSTDPLYAANGSTNIGRKRGVGGAPLMGGFNERWGHSERIQTRRAAEIAQEAGLTDAHIAAIRAVGITDVGKAQTTQDGFGKNDPEVQALADEAKAVLGGYYREFLLDQAPGRNKRSVWTIATTPYPGAHFATFPSKLVEPCILAGTSARGVCPACGAPWRRIVEEEREPSSKAGVNALRGQGSNRDRPGGAANREGREFLQVASVETTGWDPGCAHGLEPVAAVVMDPFGGSGTVGAVARIHGRRGIVIDLNPEYRELIEQRLRDPFGVVRAIKEEEPGMLRLFTDA